MSLPTIMTIRLPIQIKRKLCNSYGQLLLKRTRLTLSSRHACHMQQTHIYTYVYFIYIYICIDNGMYRQLERLQLNVLGISQGQGRVNAIYEMLIGHHSTQRHIYILWFNCAYMCLGCVCVYLFSGKQPIMLEVPHSNA